MSSETCVGEAGFARRLVNPNKEVRDRTLASVRKFILKATEDVGHLELLKLWKALYYSLWLTDSGPQSDELAESLASIIPHLVKKPHYLLLFVRCLYQTILREWSMLDQHRINKFYFFLRVSTNKILGVCISLLIKRKSNSRELVEQILECLWEEVLTRTPNGIRFHLADVYLPELSKILVAEDLAAKAISTDDFLLLMQPFLDVIRGKDGMELIFRDRVCKAIFNSFVDVYARERHSSTSGEPSPFREVDTLQLQGKVFAMAAALSTPETFRPALYDLHRRIAVCTGHAFAPTVDDEEQKEEPRQVAAESDVVGEVEENAPEVPATEKEKPKKEKRKKLVEGSDSKTSEVDQQQSKSRKLNREEEVLTSKKMEAKAAKVLDEGKEKVQEGVINPSKKEAKKQGDSEELHAIKKQKQVDDSSKSGEGLPIPSSSPPPLPLFVASKAFTGSRPGYVFQKVLLAFSTIACQSLPSFLNPSSFLAHRVHRG